MQLLQEQVDLLWDTLPDTEDDEEGEEELTPIFWSLAEAARTFGLSASTLRNQAVRGRLGAVKIGRNWSTTREWMQEYLASRKKNAKPVRSGELAPRLSQEGQKARDTVIRRYRPALE